MRQKLHFEIILFVLSDNCSHMKNGMFDPDPDERPF